jgi:Ni/Co efflux regulator RcnB
MRKKMSVKYLTSLISAVLLTGAVVASPSLKAQENHKGHNHAEEGHNHADEGKKHGHDDSHDHGKENAASHKEHHPKPVNGGVILEINEYHGELVLTDGKIKLFLSNHDGKNIETKGFKAIAMVLSAQGRQGPFKLLSVNDEFLISSDPISDVNGARVIITLTDPHGHSAQARYQMP